MFVNQSILKKLMKQAYKSNGLYMARYEGWYHLADQYRDWEVRIKVQAMPKTLLAAMVEYAGYIPEDGEAWTADKDKNQMAMTSRWLNYRAKEPIIKTPVIMQAERGWLYRVLQLPKEKTVLLVRHDLIEAIDPASIDRENGEEMISGPFYVGTDGILAATNFAEWHVVSRGVGKLSRISNLLEEGILRYDEDDEDNDGDEDYE